MNAVCEVSASGITFIKLTGVGVIVALLVDATIIRVPLVPATMRLLGRASWRAPPVRQVRDQRGNPGRTDRGTRLTAY